MSSSRAALRARAVWVGLGLAGCLSGATGCHRSSLSSFVPSLRVQLSALRSAEGTSASRDRVSWDVAVTGWLRFQLVLSIGTAWPLTFTRGSVAEAWTRSRLGRPRSSPW